MADVQHSPATERIKAIVLSLDRTMRSQRLYAKNNPTLLRHRQELVVQFDALLNERGQLVLSVAPFELTADGETVYQNRNEHESFAFRLFNDGIRTLTFRQGLTAEELADFLGAMTTDPAADEKDSDAVTSFWEREFEHIQYSVADTILNEPTADEKTTDEKIEEVVDPKMGMYRGPPEGEDDDAYENFVGGEVNITLNLAGVGRMFQDRTVLADGDLRKIQEDLAECDRDERLALDFVDMVLAVLQEEKDRSEFERTLTALGEVLDNNLLQGQLDIAALIVRQVARFPERPIRMAQSDPKLLEWTYHSLWPKERIDLLFQALNHEFRGTPDDVEDLVGSLDPSSLPQLLGLVPQVSDAALRTRVSCSVARLHRGDLGIFTRLLSSKEPENVRAGLEIVGQLRSEKVVDLIAPFVHQQNRMFRREAIEILKHLRSPKAHQLLLGLLADPAEEIRILALHSLEGTDDKEVVRTLMASVNRPDFWTRSLRERKAYFAAVARIARDDFVPYLADLLSVKSWFKKPELEEQYKLAAYGLALVASPAATEALRTAASSKNKAVRRLAESALRLAPAPAPPSSEEKA